MATFLQILLGGALIVTSIFLILLVLVQRGRGGGLAGALGGMGGSSALGTKAGDTFTRITIGAVLFWILLCIATMLLLREGDDPFGDGGLGGAPPVGGLSAPGDDAVTADESFPGDNDLVDPDRSDAGDEALEGSSLETEGAIGEGAGDAALPTP